MIYDGLSIAALNVVSTVVSEVDFFFVAWVGWRKYYFANDVVNVADLAERACYFVYAVAGSFFSDDLGISNFPIL